MLNLSKTDLWSSLSRRVRSSYTVACAQEGISQWVNGVDEPRYFASSSPSSAFADKESACLHQAIEEAIQEANHIWPFYSAAPVGVAFGDLPEEQQLQLRHNYGRVVADKVMGRLSQYFWQHEEQKPLSIPTHWHAFDVRIPMEGGPELQIQDLPFRTKSTDSSPLLNLLTVFLQRNMPTLELYKRFIATYGHAKKGRERLIVGSTKQRLHKLCAAEGLHILGTVLAERVGLRNYLNERGELRRKKLLQHAQEYLKQPKVVFVLDRPISLGRPKQKFSDGWRSIGKIGKLVAGVKGNRQPSSSHII